MLLSPRLSADNRVQGHNMFGQWTTPQCGSSSEADNMKICLTMQFNIANGADF